MRRHLLSHLEGLNSGTLEVAEAVARRCGMTLEEWVAATLADHSERREQPAKQARRKAGEDLDGIIARLTKSERKRAVGHEETAETTAAQSQRLARDEASRTAIALESMASWIEHAEERLNETARVSADHQDRMASALSQALSALKDRLDAVEHHVASERVTPPRIEFPVQDAIKALSPLSETLIGLRTDMSRLAERLEQPPNPSLSPAVEGIRADIERLRSSMGGLATRDEIAALDHAVRDVAQDLKQGRSSKDILTLATSIAAVYRQVQTLSEDLAEGVHRRIGAEIELINGKIDSIAKTSTDPSVVEFLGSQIVEMRQELARRAEPQQIERLSGEVISLSQQIADLRANQVGRGDFAALKTSLENVCSALNRTVAAQESSTVPEQIEDLSRRLDVLASRPEPEPANLDPIAEQLALLTERMAAVTDARFEQTDALTTMIERLSTQVQAVADNSPSPEPLLKRFDRLEDELRQVGQQADTSNVEVMLRSISERLEQQPASSSFDALEKRIVALADQFAQSPAEPFRQVFDDAATHLKKLQDETAAIAERAAKAALKDVQPSAPAAGDMDALKQGFVELKALQSRSDKKTQQTLRAVHEALETLVSRSPGKGMVAPLGAQAQESQGKKSDIPSADRLEAAVRRLHAAALSQMEEVSSAPVEPLSASVPEKAKVDSEAPRSIAASFSSRETDLGNVRASFIAAARRAAQPVTSDRTAAAGDMPTQATLPAGEDAKDEPASAESTLSAPSLIERIRRSIDSHRRPLLFSLAFLILAAGTTQILSGGQKPQATSSVPATPAQEMAAHVPPHDAKAPQEPIVAIAPITHDVSGLLQPSSLAAASFTTAKFLIDPGTIGDIPAQVPAVLREAALSGDAAAVYEVAALASQGRGLAYDPALAAHLYERAAQAGFAPAQERLAMLHEKGVGVPRDVKLAATWYERAAQGGNIRAMHNLATLLASGINGKADYPAALRWYSEAAEAGVRDSQFNLGVLFTRGIGTRPDLPKAYKWFALAAAQSDQEAAKKRDEVAAKLGAADLAAAKTLVERWQPRTFDPAANEASGVAGQTAALEPIARNRS